MNVKKILFYEMAILSAYNKKCACYSHKSADDEMHNSLKITNLDNVCIIQSTVDTNMLNKANIKDTIFSMQILKKGRN